MRCLPAATLRTLACMHSVSSSGRPSPDGPRPTGDFGVELAKLRARRGWTVRELAIRANVSPGHICNLESGRRTPTPAVAAACDAAFNVGGMLIRLAEATPRSAHAKGPVQLDSLVAGYERVLEELKNIGRSTGPRFVAGPLRANVRILTDAASHAGGNQRDDIWLLASRTAEYTGWMAQEAGNPAEALRWTDLSVRWGEYGGDETAAAYAFVRKAFIAEHRGDPDASIKLAAQAAMHRAATPLIRAHAARREAQGHAHRGDFEACYEALARSREHARQDSGPDARWGPRITNGNPHLIEASCLIALRRFEHAANLFTTELERHAGTPADSNSQTRFAVRHATAIVGADRLDEACHVISAVLPTVRLLDSATIRAELSRFVNQARTRRATPGQRNLIATAAAIANGRHLTGAMQ